MKRLLLLLLTAVLLLSACSGGGATDNGSDETEESESMTTHQHTYTMTRVEPTRKARGYDEYTCACGDNYRDNETGLGFSLSKKISVLFIGNSYTYGNNLERIFLQLAQGEGFSLTSRRATEPGWDLLGHADGDSEVGEKTAKAIALKPNYVFIQEQSLRPAIEPELFFQGVTAINKKLTAVGSQGILYQTWGRKPGSPDLAANDLTNETMTQKLAAAYEAIGEKLGLPVSPAGSAFYDITVNHPEIELYLNDKTHASEMGSYLAALCHYATLYGLSPIGVSYRMDLDEATAKILQEAAHKAVFGGSIVKDEYREPFMTGDNR